MRQNVRHAIFCSPFLLAALALATQAQAAVINIDYSNDRVSQAGAVGAFSTTGAIWNGVSGNQDLVDEFGSDTGVSVSQWNVLGCSGDVDPGALELFADTMFVDAASGGNDWHAISGLIEGNEYDIAVYGGRASDKLVSRAAIVHGDGTAISDYFGYESGKAGLPGVEGAHYVTFTGLTPWDLGGGNFGLIIKTAATDGRLNVITGLQLRDAGQPNIVESLTTQDVASLPEPASLTIWSLGALGCALAAYRRRRQPTA